MTQSESEFPVDRSGWLRQLLETAPGVPPCFLRFLSAALADPRATSDYLLLIADALEEAATAAEVSGRKEQPRELRALADQPRRLAPHRVEPLNARPVPAERLAPRELSAPPLLLGRKHPSTQTDVRTP